MKRFFAVGWLALAVALSSLLPQARADALSKDTRDGVAPLDRAFAITPADGSDLAQTTRYVWIGGCTTAPCDVKVDFAGTGTGITITKVPAGTLLPLKVRRVYSTGSAAGLVIVGFY